MRMSISSSSSRGTMIPTTRRRNRSRGTVGIRRIVVEWGLLAAELDLGARGGWRVGEDLAHRKEEEEEEGDDGPYCFFCSVAVN